MYGRLKHRTISSPIKTLYNKFTHKIKPVRLIQLKLELWSSPRGGGGGLTDKWYTGMLKGFGVHFRNFGILMGGFWSQTQCAQFAKLGVFPKILPKKHTICPKLGAFL